MQIIFDKRGNAIEAVLDKDEQLALAKENNRRAKLFQEHKQPERFDAYDTAPLK